MSRRHTGIAVIESRWWQDKNTSIRGLFDLIADISCNNPHRYHYEMAGSEIAIKEAIPRIGQYSDCKYLYIAMHGDVDGLYLHNDEKLTRTELRNCLAKLGHKPTDRIHGLHLGSCIFGTKNIAEFLFQKNIGVTWVSGYAETVDWMDSSALDLLLFNQLAYKSKTLFPGVVIKKVAKRILKLAPGLIAELGFGIYVRKGRRGEVTNLLEAAYSENKRR